VDAPAAQGLAAALHELAVAGAVAGDVERDLGALDGGVEAGLGEAAVGVEHHLPGLAAAPGVEQDGARVGGEDRDEADAELADLGEVAVLARGEQARQLIVDDRLVHALAGVVDVDDDRALVGAAVARRQELHPHVDRVRAGVDAVLDQLAVEIEGRAELGDEVLDRLNGEVDLELGRRRHGVPGPTPQSAGVPW
jgi:hypothetical protein